MKRDPQQANREADIEKLCEIRDHVQHELKLDGQLFDSSALE